MGAMPSPTKRYPGLLPLELSAEAPAVRAADAKNDRLPNGYPSRGRRAALPLARFLFTFYIGVAATLAWQSYSDAARQIIAGLSPQLAWLAPQAAAAQAAPDPIDPITRGVDRIATTIAASQDQIVRSVENLAAGQERMTREISKLQTIDQYLLYRDAEYKKSEPPPRPVKSAQRPPVR